MSKKAGNIGTIIGGLIVLLLAFTFPNWNWWYFVIGWSIISIMVGTAELADGEKDGKD